ncbi:hypothetical protein C4D60_Mb11t01170 [Musa balbisiana]|uniref:Succinate dehydrogenase subunit 3 n=1 Tax=Musa balbisiana TaxID=52838 RepID=A0A4S8J2C1_MUSBA|nr:hypothetical protein C4D60_Mb11t01170 [Musa balbisiana]
MATGGRGDKELRQQEALGIGGILLLLRSLRPSETETSERVDLFVQVIVSCARFFSGPLRWSNDPTLWLEFGCQKTLMSFPHGSSRHSMRFQPRVVPHQTRAFHGSRAVSVSAKGVVANRPLSPHLPVKKPQLSATFSISHRILGASLGTVIMLTPLLMKFSTAYNI